MFALSISTGNHAVDVSLLALSTIATILAGTRAFTEVRYWLQSRGNAGRFEGREPLTLPYTIPWLAGLLRVTNAHAMYDYAQ